MNNSEFCHLHVHNDKSFLDGLGSAQSFVRKAKEMGFTNLGLTNHGNIDGLLEFQRECRKEKIRPVFGCEMYIVPNMGIKQKGEKRGHITILVKNQTGWKELCRLLTISNVEGFYYRPRIDFPTLLRTDLSGFIIMTACSSSFVNISLGEAFLWDLQERMKEDLYIEVMPHYTDVYKEHNKTMKILKEKYGLKFVGTNDCHYVKKEDAQSHEVLLAIQSKSKWEDKNRWKFDVDTLYLQNANEMKNSFLKQGILAKTEIISALRNTMRIAEKCDFTIEKKSISLPENIPVKLKDREYSDDILLEKLCLKGMKRRGLEEKEDYKERLKYELKIVAEKKLSRYFLVVYELIRWCKKKEFVISSGRGSVGGCLIAYVLGITSVDPLKFNLLFSRFINEERIDYPDIDLDFEDIRRDEIRRHLEEVYGKENVAGISTFLSMKGKAVIRDVARVFDVPLKEVNEFTKYMTDDGLENNIDNVFAKKYPQVIKHALCLENTARGTGQHAAGIVISPETLYISDKGNLCVRNGETVINWEMQDVEYMGLVKLDILGLNTLTVLGEVKRLVQKNHGKEIIFEDISLENSRICKDISEGNTVGIFQLQTWALTKLCKEMGINNFDDIVAALALVRPGSMDSGMTEEYIARKHGEIWKKKHSIYEEITKDTYGVVIYQEQVMQVIHKVAGLPYSTADNIRKIIGKKRDVKEFEPYWKIFSEGCAKTGIFSKEDAEWFWDMVLKCASYLFNKSHSVEYAMLAWWTAWCKQYYPIEFICACLTYGGESKKDDYIKEAKRLGLIVMPPKMGTSDVKRWTIHNGKIYIPFLEVKGIGEQSVRKIFEKKESKQKSFYKRKEQNIIEGKVGKILKDIGAYEEDKIPEGIGKYFSFNIVNDCQLK